MMMNSIGNGAELLNSGVRNLAAGRSELARKDFLALLDESTSSTDQLSRVLALYNLGVLDTQIGESGAAENWFIQALAAANDVDFGLVVELAHSALNRIE